MSARKSKNKKIPPGIKCDVLQSVHNSGYVCNQSLAAILNVDPVVTWRIIKELENENRVRLVGEPIRCPYPPFSGLRFYTATNADVRNACEKSKIKPFKVQHRHQVVGKVIPVSDLLVHRYVKDDLDSKVEPAVEGAKKRRRKNRKTKQERIPIHYAGSHVAAGLFASVFNESEDVTNTFFVPERALRRSEDPIEPMPDGMFYCKVDGEDHAYRIEFEGHEKKAYRYKKLFDILEHRLAPTVYITLTPDLAVFLDRMASNRKNIAVVMLGDYKGCVSAVEGLLRDFYWQSIVRYPDGPMAGFDRVAAEAGEDEEVRPPGARHLDAARIAKIKAGLSVLKAA